jgi:hypothetical protein
MECIAYKSGYKYQLKEDYVTVIGIKPISPIKTDYIELTAKGKLTIKKVTLGMALQARRLTP